MKTYKALSLTSLIALAAVGFASGAVEATTDSILIKTDSTFQPQLTDITFGTSPSADLGIAGWRKVTLPRSASVATALAFYKKAPGVIAVEQNFIARALGLPNDPALSKQYWVPITKAPQAWDVFKGSGSFTVAVLDSGSDYTHEDLKSKIISKGKDFINNDDDAMDDNGHGTHCAGLVGAATNNGLGGTGMGYNITILPVKVLGAGGGGSFDAVIGGMKWAADSQARVLSMSLGGYGFSNAMQDAADYVAGKGKIIVAAAGNDNLDAATTPMYPANLKNVFSVAATTSTDARAGFSNYGDKEIDVAAPGEGIYSTIWPGGGYAYESGTSMACPIVAGLVGLVWSYSPTEKHTTILDAIMKTSDNVGPFVISGRVNAFRAVDYFTVATPVSATLVSRSIFQGTSVSGTAPVANIRSINAQGVGQIAAISSTYKMPSNPIAGLKKTNITTTFGAHATGTAQLFLWNYSTGKYDLVNSVPGSGGRISYETTVMPAQYYDRTTRNFSLIVRMLVPNRPGSSTSTFVFPVNSMSAVFSYRANP